MKQIFSTRNRRFEDRPLPHNFLAEQMILSALLIDSEAVEVTLKVLPIDAFYFSNHQEIYRAISLMYQKKLPIDVLTLITFLQDNGRLEKIGGIKVLIELLSQIPNLIYLEQYVQLVKDKFIRRSLIRLGYQAISSGYMTNNPLEKVLTNFEQQIFRLTTKIKSPKVFTSAELLNDVFFELKERSLNPQSFGINSGFYDLDSLTQGFQKSDLIILAGRPSMGKTAFGLNIAANIIKSSKLPVIFFSLEMSKEQIIYRLLSMEADINQMRLKSGKLSQSDWARLNKVIKILSRLPLFIDDTSSLSIPDIRSKLKTIIFEQGKIGLIIIDYLQLMQNSLLKNENRVQELSQITRSLKILAREFNIPVIALSQLSRNVENRVDKKPILSDLRESGSIEQDADVVLMLYRDQSNNGNKLDLSVIQSTELIIAKQRNGPIGSIKLEFDEKRTKFLNDQIFPEKD